MVKWNAETPLENWYGESNFDSRKAINSSPRNGFACRLVFTNCLAISLLLFSSGIDIAGLPKCITVRSYSQSTKSLRSLRNYKVYMQDRLQPLHPRAVALRLLFSVPEQQGSRLQYVYPRELYLISKSNVSVEKLARRWCRRFCHHRGPETYRWESH